MSEGKHLLEDLICVNNCGFDTSLNSYELKHKENIAKGTLHVE